MDSDTQQTTSTASTTSTTSLLALTQLVELQEEFCPVHHRRGRVCEDCILEAISARAGRRLKMTPVSEILGRGLPK